MAVLLALDEAVAQALRDDLPLAGHVVAECIPPSVLDERIGRGRALTAAGPVQAVIMPADRGLVGTTLLSACDRAGVRILLLGDGERARRLARRHGLADPLPADATAWAIADALASASRPGVAPPTDPTDEPPRAGRLIAVWGPHGAPGRTTVAVQLAATLAGSGSVALVDADTHAPAIAFLLGIDDDAPGLAAACRRAERGQLDGAELSRLARPVETAGGTLDVLAGLNRPSRWPELSTDRLRATLTACRAWADTTIVDVAAGLEADEELLSDLSIPSRNAATRTVLDEADHVLAVAAADPLGVARFVRDYPEVRAHAADARISVLVNRLRPGPLGIDARGQVRRALDRFSGISDVQFLPADPKGPDAALLHARPVSDVAPRSAFAAAIRRVAASLERADAPLPPSPAGASGRRRRNGRRPDALR